MNVGIVIGNIGRGRIGFACRATSFGTMPAFAGNVIEKTAEDSSQA